MNRLLRLLGLACALVGCSSATTEDPTLCELSVNRGAYAGRTVTVEGLLLVSRHGSLLEDVNCDGGIPIEWYEGDGLHELDAAVGRDLNQPPRTKVRVTGEMRRAARSAFLNEPYWYLRLQSADVLHTGPHPD